jgi:hypothetical protein
MFAFVRESALNWLNSHAAGLIYAVASIQNAVDPLCYTHGNDGRASPSPRRTDPTASVTDMPRAVLRLSTAMRIWISATCLSQPLSVRHWPINLVQRQSASGPCQTTTLDGSDKLFIPLVDSAAQTRWGRSKMPFNKLRPVSIPSHTINGPDACERRTAPPAHDPSIILLDFPSRLPCLQK